MSQTNRWDPASVARTCGGRAESAHVLDSAAASPGDRCGIPSIRLGHALHAARGEPHLSHFSDLHGHTEHADGAGRASWNTLSAIDRGWSNPDTAADREDGSTRPGDTRGAGPAIRFNHEVLSRRGGGTRNAGEDSQTARADSRQARERPQG